MMTMGDQSRQKKSYKKVCSLFSMSNILRFSDYLFVRICMRMAKIENERNNFIEAQASRKEEVSPPTLASRKMLRFV